MNDLSTAGVETFDRGLLLTVEHWLAQKGWTLHPDSADGAKVGRKRYRAPWGTEEWTVPFSIEDACMMQVYRDAYSRDQSSDEPVVVLFAWLGERAWRHLAGTTAFSYHGPEYGWDYDIENAVMVQVYRDVRKKLGIEDRGLKAKKPFFMMARPK